MGFWGAILLPMLIGLLLFTGFFTNSAKLASLPPALLWMQFAGAILSVMGTLLLPIYIVFISYSVNSMEHKADTWKTLFSLPVSKWSVYAAKYFYALFLVFLCLLLFVLFTLGLGNLLGILKPGLKFTAYHPESFLFQIYLKLFLAALGILSIQFLLSLVWSDFLKPMGIGFVSTIAAAIMSGTGWQYAYLFPYAHPFLAIHSIITRGNGAIPVLSVDYLTKDTFISLGVAVVVFIAGYFIVLKKSVK